MSSTPLMPLTNPSLDHVFPILVGFDYWDRDVSPASVPVLRGMINDVVAEWRMLQRVGIPPRNVHIVTDAAPEDVRARLEKADVWHDDLHVEQVATSQDMVRFLTHSPLADVAEADFDKVKALVLWSGHGGESPEPGDRSPALFLPDGSDLTVGELLVLVKPLWTWMGARPGEPPALVAVLNACHTASMALVARPDMPTVGFADFGAVAIAASGASAAAHEVYIDGQWRSALSWAVTTVISRYRSHANGALALTYDELMFRIRSLLVAIDVPDLPRLFAPQDEANRLILRGYGDWGLGESATREGRPIEIYPTTDCEVLVGMIEGAIKGQLLTAGGGTGWDTSWTNAGYAPDHMYFIWEQSPDWKTFDVQPSFENGKPKAWDTRSDRAKQGAPDLNQLPAGHVLEAFPLAASWTKKTPFDLTPSHVIRAGSAIQRWLTVGVDAHQKRTLTFYRQDSQTDVSSKSVRLAFREQTDQIKNLTHTVTETAG